MTRKEILTQRLLLYRKAERDITSSGQTVELEGMRITRASLDTVRKEIKNLEQELDGLDDQEKVRAKRRSRIRAIVPL